MHTLILAHARYPRNSQTMCICREQCAGELSGLLQELKDSWNADGLAVSGKQVLIGDFLKWLHRRRSPGYVQYDYVCVCTCCGRYNKPLTGARTSYKKRSMSLLPFTPERSDFDFVVFQRCTNST